MFSAQAAADIQRSLTEMRDANLFNITELKDNLDILGKDLLLCNEAQQTRALALRYSHLDALKTLQAAKAAANIQVAPQTHPSAEPGAITTESAERPVGPAPENILETPVGPAPENKIVNFPATTRDEPGDKTKGSDDGGDPGEIPTEVAGHTREPTQSSSKKNAALQKMVKESVGANINAVAESDVQNALAQIKKANPVEFGLLLDTLELKGTAKGILKKIVEEKVIKLELAAKRALETVETEMDRRAKTKVREIITAGTTFEYIYEVWQSRVKGNANLGQTLILSRGAQSCTNTKGIHVWAIGMPGQGKSEGEVVAVELSPPVYVIDTDPSPKVLYYMQDTIQPGTTVNIDDIDLAGALAGLFKKMTTRYQEGARHDVVIDGEVFAYQLPPRVSIWTSSVDMQGDEQSRDRFVFIPIDEKQTAAIIGFMKDKDKKSETNEDKAFQTAVVRGLLLDLAQQTFFVEIPFADDFYFPATQGTRGYGIFSDFIKSLTAMRYAVRKMNSAGHLLAEPQDFYDAKALYESLEGHSAMAFTTAEKEVLSALIALNRKATLVQLEKESGKSIPRLKEIFNGRSSSEQKRHGLLTKCPSLSVESETVSTLTRYGETKSETKSNKCNVYTLDPAFRLIRGCTELIPVIEGTKLADAKKSDAI